MRRATALSRPLAGRSVSASTSQASSLVNARALLPAAAAPLTSSSASSSISSIIPARRPYASQPNSPTNILSKISWPTTGVEKHKLYGWTSLGLAITVPAALIFPSSLSAIPDYALLALIPVHSHIGLDHVIGDYVPRPIQGISRIFLILLTAATFFGLAKINIKGSGITATAKQLWAKEPKNKVKEPAEVK